MMSLLQRLRHQRAFASLPSAPPILIDLIGGNFNIFTSDTKSVIITGVGEKFAPQSLHLHPQDQEGTIRVGGQNLMPFFEQRKRIKYDIYIPESRPVSLTMRAGSVTFNGVYTSIKSRVDIGETVFNIDSNHTTKVDADMLIGSLVVRNSWKHPISYEKKSFFNNQLTINSRASFNCRMRIVGGIDIYE